MTEAKKWALEHQVERSGLSGPVDPCIVHEGRRLDVVVPVPLMLAHVVAQPRHQGVGEPFGLHIIIAVIGSSNIVPHPQQ